MAIEFMYQLLNNKHNVSIVKNSNDNMTTLNVKYSSAKYLSNNLMLLCNVVEAEATEHLSVYIVTEDEICKVLDVSPLIGTMMPAYIKFYFSIDDIEDEFELCFDYMYQMVPVDYSEFSKHEISNLANTNANRFMLRQRSSGINVSIDEKHFGRITFTKLDIIYNMDARKIYNYKL